MTRQISMSSRVFICASLIAFTAAGTSALAKAQDRLSSQITVPGIMETETGVKPVEITLYDANMVARINDAEETHQTDKTAFNDAVETSAEPQLEIGTQIDPQSFAAVPDNSDTGSEAVTVSDEASIVPSSPKVDAQPVSLPIQHSKTTKEKPKFPRDISDQVFEVIAGVPIIENPKKCDTDELDVDIIVTNVSDSKGTIVADLHNDVEEDFLVWDRVVLRVRMPATEGETKFCMPLTKPGDYAIAVYHDKNGNKEFDKNFLGLPKERFGMSRDPKFGTKSPKLEETIFTVPDTGADIKITLFSTGDILGGQKKK